MVEFTSPSSSPARSASREAALDSIFHALGDSTRRAMLQKLAEGEHSVSALAEPFAMSLAAASKHIKALESAGLIEREVQGRVHVCRLAPGPLASAHEWLAHYERFWQARLDALEELLRADDRRNARSKPPAGKPVTPKRAARTPAHAKPVAHRKTKGTRT